MWKPSKKRFISELMRLMSTTTPAGFEHFIHAMLPGSKDQPAPGADRSLEMMQWIDEHNNYHVLVSAVGEEPTTMWTSHCDTADRTPTKVNFVRSGDVLKTDGKSILGADDRTGIAIMVMMIKARVPGWYVFFAGEEIGCKGSGDMAEEAHVETYIKRHIKHCVSFDRYGFKSIITHQCGRRTASDEWAQELADRLNRLDPRLASLEPDSGGLFTDSNEFRSMIPECTNISVGYAGHHTSNENQDMDFAWRVCCAFIEIGIEGMPEARRDPTVVDADDRWSYGCVGSFRSIWDDDIDMKASRDKDERSAWSESERSWYMEDNVVVTDLQVLSDRDIHLWGRGELDVYLRRPDFNIPRRVDNALSTDGLFLVPFSNAEMYADDEQTEERLKKAQQQRKTAWKI